MLPGFIQLYQIKIQGLQHTSYFHSHCCINKIIWNTFLVWITFQGLVTFQELFKSVMQIQAVKFKGFLILYTYGSCTTYVCRKICTCIQVPLLYSISQNKHFHWSVNIKWLTPGLRNQWSVDCNVISQWPELVNVHPFDASLRCILGRHQWVVTNGLRGRTIEYSTVWLSYSAIYMALQYEVIVQSFSSTFYWHKGQFLAKV